MSAIQMVCDRCGEQYLAGMVGTTPWAAHRCLERVPLDELRDRLLAENPYRPALPLDDGANALAYEQGVRDFHAALPAWLREQLLSDEAVEAGCEQWEDVDMFVHPTFARPIIEAALSTFLPDEKCLACGAPVEHDAASDDFGLCGSCGTDQYDEKGEGDA